MINRAFGDTLKLSEVARKMTEPGYEPIGGSPDDFATLIRSELDTLGPFFKKIKTTSAPDGAGVNSRRRTMITVFRLAFPYPN